MPCTVFQERAALSKHLDSLRKDGRQIGVVPTMGALHAGHLSLIKEARKLTDFVVTTIFVNPTQFAPGEDFEAYPRDLSKDVQAAESAGTDVIFAPSVAEMYPALESTQVQVRGISEGLCGASRPGHFDGVTTIVAKLFHVVGPSTAFFGQKDYQQLKVIEAMVRELFIPIKIVGLPTIREADGLALSSRNAYLSPQERQQALQISESLQEAKITYEGGVKSGSSLLQLVRTRLLNAGLDIDYIELRDAISLAPLDDSFTSRAVLAVAARVGTTRLIDNLLLNESPRSAE